MISALHYYRPIHGSALERPILELKCAKMHSMKRRLWAAMSVGVVGELSFFEKQEHSVTPLKKQ